MDDILDMLMGVDKKGEIFTLWYEVTFLRMVLNNIFSFNPELHEKMTEDVYDQARKEAQEHVKSRFPSCNIDFSKPGCRGRVNQEPASTLPEDESKRKAEEALRNFRRWAEEPKSVIEDQRADPSCTPQVLTE
jgi:hypothetical protein